MGTPIILGITVLWCIGNYILIRRIMIDLTKLTEDVQAIATVVPSIKADYDTLKATIATLQGSIDPTAQAKIDELVASMDSSFAELKGLDDSVQPPVTPPVVPVN